MQINSVNSYGQNFYQPVFGVNLLSPKLRFNDNDFYVRIKGYGHNAGWAKKIKETADKAVDYIRKKCNFEETLKEITNGVTEANSLITEDTDKVVHTGILRTKREGWRYGSEWGDDLITSYNKKNRYKTYADRLDFIVKNPLKNPFRIELTRPKHDKDFGKYLEHGSGKYVNTAFYYIKKIYEHLYNKYITNEVRQANIADINGSIAEIRWILAHSMPWERGSDAISNTFIRSVYKAMGIKTYPLKKGVSLDMEAFCTNLDEYKKNFSEYFSKSPRIIN